MITEERMEKWVLRKAFEEYLTESVAWRQKNSFLMVLAIVGSIP